MSLLAALACFVLTSSSTAQRDACNLDSVLCAVEAAYASVNDYSCILSKKEFIDGEYIVWSEVLYKFRKPDNYYMKWTAGSMEGREVIYAGARYGKALKVHVGGFWNLMTFSLDPTGSIAMSTSRHPITESDLGFMIRQMRENVQRAKQEPSARIECLGATIACNRKSMHYRAWFPEKKGFINHVVVLYIDSALHLPIKIEMHDWTNRLVESYSFSALKLNTGLKDIDFDVENPAYEF